MKKLVDWLIDVEKRAEELYEKAATRCGADTDFAMLVKTLEQDERAHHSMMLAAKKIANEADRSVIAYVNDESKKNIEDRLLSLEGDIEAGKLDEDALIERIVESEFSEWNDIFLYVANTFKHNHREFIPAVASIQGHKKKIERFLKQRPRFKRHLERLRQIPDIWREKILVADDDDMIADVINAIISNEGDVERASNGREALEKIDKKYYAAIISDIDMPVVDGIEFFEKALRKYPSIGRRFLFFAADFGSGRIEFLRKHRLRYLEKPSSIKLIRDTVTRMLAQDTGA